MFRPWLVVLIGLVTTSSTTTSSTTATTTSSTTPTTTSTSTRTTSSTTTVTTTSTTTSTTTPTTTSSTTSSTTPTTSATTTSTSTRTTSSTTTMTTTSTTSPTTGSTTLTSTSSTSSTTTATTTRSSTLTTTSTSTSSTTGTTTISTTPTTTSSTTLTTTSTSTPTTSSTTTGVAVTVESTCSGNNIVITATGDCTDVCTCDATSYIFDACLALDDTVAPLSNSTAIIGSGCNRTTCAVVPGVNTPMISYTFTVNRTGVYHLVLPITTVTNAGTQLTMIARIKMTYLAQVADHTTVAGDFISQQYVFNTGVSYTVDIHIRSLAAVPGDVFHYTWPPLLHAELLNVTCRALTVCAEGEVETTAATEISNRVCGSSTSTTTTSTTPTTTPIDQLVHTAAATLDNENLAPVGAHAFVPNRRRSLPDPTWTSDDATAVDTFLTTHHGPISNVLTALRSGTYNPITSDCQYDIDGNLFLDARDAVLMDSVVSTTDRASPIVLTLAERSATSTTLTLFLERSTVEAVHLLIDLALTSEKVSVGTVVTAGTTSTRTLITTVRTELTLVKLAFGLQQYTVTIETLADFHVWLVEQTSDNTTVAVCGLANSVWADTTAYALGDVATNVLTGCTGNGPWFNVTTGSSSSSINKTTWYIVGGCVGGTFLVLITIMIVQHYRKYRGFSPLSQRA